MLRLLGHLLGLVPAVYLSVLMVLGRMGVNPVEWLTHQTGKWALIILLASWAGTPLVKITHVKKLMPWRRTLGLWACFYACLHFLTYLVFDLSFAFKGLAADVIKRPYITVGFAAFLIVLVLAVTSTQKWRRQLGRRWVLLHRTVYVANALVLLHLFWLIKADLYRFWWYAAVFVVLMALRVKNPVVD